ncbi:MAG: flagellar protein FlaG [Bacillota bacterium]
MRVDGIDPLVLSRVKDQTKNSPVQETDRSDAERTLIKRQQQENKANQAAVEGEAGQLREVEEAIMKLNDTAEAMQLSLRFLMHEGSERWMVQVVDIQQDEIVREMPPEKVLNVVAQIQDLIGVLLDERR